MNGRQEKEGSKKSLRWQWLPLKLLICLGLIVSGSFYASAAEPPPEFFARDTDLSGQRLVSDAWVIKDGDTYKMWFTHPKTDVTPSKIAGLVSSLDIDAIIDALEEEDMDALLKHLSELDKEKVYDLIRDSATVIGYATSSNGVDWNIEDPNVHEAGHELQSVAAPCVIEVDGEYHMWYSRNVMDYTLEDIEELLIKLGSEDEEEVKEAIIDYLEGEQTVIDYATSSDGVDWQVEAEAVMTGAGDYLGDAAGAPSVIEDGEGGWEMWFSNLSTGITQQDIEDLVDNIEDVSARDLWQMQEMATASIGYATSGDGEDWTNINRNVFSPGSGALNAVAAPSVIEDGDGGYEMWYSYGVTDFSPEDIDPILEELKAIDINHLLDLLEAEDFDSLLEEFVDIIDNQIPETKSRLEGTSTIIGYATSGDGLNWDVIDPYALQGEELTPWAGVGRPCVVKTGDFYEMWFTRGIDELTAQNLVDLWQGTISTIGYATSAEEIDLYEGWNFIGLPLEPVPAEPEEVFANVIEKVQRVWTYDAESLTWSYFTTVEGVPPGELTQMQAGAGYWVLSSEDGTLKLTGQEPEYPYHIELEAGWNLVSVPKTPEEPAIEDVLDGIIENVQRVWTYDAESLTWTYFTTVEGVPPGELTEVIKGRAYWILMTDEDTLVIS